MTLRSKYVDTPSLRYHYLVQGEPDGLPVLFLHGSYGSSRWWLPVLELLPDELLAVAPDLRGCGRSDKTDDGYGIEGQADDLWQFVRALEWSDFDLVGHSTGGATATEFALRHMEDLHSLTLVDSVPVEGVYSSVDTLHVLAQMREDPELLTQALQTLMPSYFPISENDNRRQAYFDSLVLDAQNMAPAAFTEIAHAVSSWNRFRDAQRLTLPTSIVWGEMDQIVEKDAITRTLIAIPGAGNLEVMRGVGHCPMIESPLAFAEILINFITDDIADYNELKSNATPLE